MTTVRSEDLPRSDRFDWWCDLVDRTLAPTRLSSGRADDFRASALFLDLGVARVSALSVPALRSRRTPALIRRSDPETFGLALVTHGTTGMSGYGHDTGLGRGDFLLYDTSRPYDAWAGTDRGTAGLAVVHLPVAAVLLPPDRTRTLLGRRLPGDGGIGAVLRPFLEGLVTGSRRWSPQDAARLGSVTLDLATAFLAHHLDLGDRLPAETGREVLMGRIHAFIERHLGDPGLSPSSVASAHHISLRYLHRLFEQQGSTIGAWIRLRRLERCRRDLSDLHRHHEPIHAVAARWGFTHPEQFSRQFRAAYGMTPRDWRRYAAGTVHGASGSVHRASMTRGALDARVRGVPTGDSGR
ncbi:helix-turn-helix domain-containing protein [Streptomyces sp. NPDC005648]|uniref:helix-turn-helix domain-containing protein n=1 Tax=Streptomyces sp. NPDC005648 TaxID=3157044 RepID=UPI0033B83938